MSHSKKLLNAAACECMSPDQYDIFEIIFSHEALCKGFLNCIEKRLFNPFLVYECAKDNK